MIDYLRESFSYFIYRRRRTFLYNIHYQMNPEKVTKTGHDYAAVLKKIEVMEY